MLNNFLKVPRKLGPEAKFSCQSDFRTHYAVWLGDSPLLQVLLDVYARKWKLEHVWIILVIFKSFEIIGESFNVAKANVRQNEFRKEWYSPSLKLNSEEDGSRDSKLSPKPPQCLDSPNRCLGQSKKETVARNCMYS